MRVEFENTINEYIDLQLYLKKNDKKQKIFFILLKYAFILFCIIEAIKYFITHNDSSRYIILIFFIFIIFLWIIIVPKLVYNATKKGINITLNKSPSMLEKRVLTIFEDTIIVSDTKDNTIIEFNIDDVYKTIKIKNSLYIFKDNLKVYVIIPLDSFENELDRKNLLTLLDIKK